MDDDWLRTVGIALGIEEDGLANALFVQRRLRVRRPDVQCDDIDRLSAQVLVTGRRRGIPVLVVLPDRQPHRPAVLLASAILSYWSDQRAAAQLGANAAAMALRPVLYLGATAGSHVELSRVEVPGVRLQDVFQQSRVGRSIPRRRVVSSSATSDSLPELITGVAPLDPATLIRQVRPGIVVLDLGDGARTDWAASVVRAAVEMRLPVVGWSSTPFGTGPSAFRDAGQVFTWPHGSGRMTLRPLLVANAKGEDFAGHCRSARRSLIRAFEHCSDGVARSALTASWGRLRSIEQLAVPYAFHEAEVGRFWGLRTFAAWRQIGERFVLAVNRSPAFEALSVAGHSMDDAEEILKEVEPPLWRALADVCIEGAPLGEARIILFPGAGRLQLFELAMLALHNLTRADLQSVRSWLVTPRELQRLANRRAAPPLTDGDETDWIGLGRSAKWLPCIVGMPSVVDGGGVRLFLDEPSADILLYPHQEVTLSARVRELSRYAACDQPRQLAVIGQLTGRPAMTPPVASDAAIVLTEPSWVEVDGSSASQTSRGREDGSYLDTEAELRRVLDEPDDQHEEAGEHERDPAEVHDHNAGDDWCETAIELELEHGWRLRCAPDALVQVVARSANGTRAEARFIRAVRIGDQLVVVHGQRRQSLYELIVSRLHQHPAMALNLALIRRWQSEASLSFARAQRERRLTLDSLLAGLQRRGSRISSTQAVGMWLRGDVIAPQDADDLRRLAAELDIPFVHEQYQRISRAASRLRGLHRGLANRVNHWLAASAGGHMEEQDAEVVDSELDLRFGDFRRALMVLTVVAITTQIGPFLRDDLGTPEHGG